MKKAKEYYADLKPVFETSDVKAIETASYVVFRALILEIDDIKKMRNARCNSAMMAIINEQNDKWNSICCKAKKDDLGFMNENALKEYLVEELKIDEKLL